MALQVKMNKKVIDNPFYGKSNTKELLNIGKSCSTKLQMWSMLDKAWNECKDTKETREGFFIFIFSIGEITNRQHNILGKSKVDNGGNAARPQFMWIMSWMRKTIPVQYYKFMVSRVIVEFVSWFVLLAAQIRTTKGKKSINTIDTETYSSLKEHDLNKLAEYVATTINKGNLIDKVMLSKWLVIPRFSTRQKLNKSKEKDGRRNLQDETLKLMKVKQDFLVKLSEIMHWELIQHKNNIEFRGLKEFKKTYNQNLESVLFSTGKIKELDKEQFFKLLNEAPAGAKYRIQRRLMNGDAVSKGKWISNYGNVDFAFWYKEWENYKEVKQQEERVLTEKVRQGTATEEDVTKLKQTKKEAKVNVGANTLYDLVKEIITKSNSISPTVIHSLMDKINLQVPIAVIGDVSGSMGNGSGMVDGMLPFQISTMIATALMLKNPSTEMDNILVNFGDTCEIFTDNSKVEAKSNRFMQGNMVTVPKLIDRTKDFAWNYSNLLNFLQPRNQGTHLSCVAERFKTWIESDPALKSNKIEQLQSILVWVVVSDGDLNSDSSAGESMRRFQSILEHYGCNPVVVVIDVATSNRSKSNVFENCPNVIHYFGWNIGVVNQIFSNLHDLDVIDVYTELKSLWQSNRYEVIRQNTL